MMTAVAPRPAAMAFSTRRGAEVIAAVQDADANTLAQTNDDLECPLEGTSADTQLFVE